MLRIGLIGCGKWGEVVANEIRKHNFFNLASVVCNSKFKYDGDFVHLNRIKESINKEINDCLYVAALPSTNMEVVKLASEIKMPLIIEKPSVDNYSHALELRKLVKDKNLIVFPNTTNYFSETYKKIKFFVDTNLYNIEKLTIFEGGFGPFRKNIHPIWDWGYHPLSLIIHLFKDNKISSFQMSEIKKNLLDNKKIVSRFNFKINKNISVKLVTGNFFKTKKRVLKISLKNKQYFLCDMIEHKLYFNNKNIHKNKISPINSILNNFYLDIKNQDNNLSKNLIDTSCIVTEILEKFYPSSKN